MSADGPRMFMMLKDRDPVAVIDLKTMTVVEQVKTGRSRMVWLGRGGEVK